MRASSAFSPSATALTTDLFRSTRLPFSSLLAKRNPIILKKIFAVPRPPAPSPVRLFAAVSAMASAYKPEVARFPPAIQPPAPHVSKFKIALCQLSVTADKERNIAHARWAIEEAAAKGAQLVLLPGRGDDSPPSFGCAEVQFKLCYRVPPLLIYAWPVGLR